jgi:hypothetical protein
MVQRRQAVFLLRRRALNLRDPLEHVMWLVHAMLLEPQHRCGDGQEGSALLSAT